MRVNWARKKLCILLHLNVKVVVEIYLFEKYGVMAFLSNFSRDIQIKNYPLE
ncbi:hypothetical protein D3C78_1910060 [compost metagenome]